MDFNETTVSNHFFWVGELGGLALARFYYDMMVFI